MMYKIAEQIRSRINNRTPQTAIILGSGLGALAEEINNPIIIDYKDIDGFPQSTVQGHGGKLIIGELEGKEVLCMQGRIHLYEGYPPSTINLIIKSFQIFGIKNLIVTNAAGSLNPDFAPGSLMLIKDHINLSGTNPLIGPNDDTLGPRFPGMANAYTPVYMEKVRQIAQKLNIHLNEGVYLWTLGPCFETAAEIRMFQTLGGDAVGMSTVPEVICAVHSGMKILGISVITNYGTGMMQSTPSHEETLRESNKASADLIRLVKQFIREM